MYLTNNSYSDTIDSTLNLTNLIGIKIIGIKLIGIILIGIKTVGYKRWNSTLPSLSSL